jgi:hypothetical protein
VGGAVSVGYQCELILQRVTARGNKASIGAVVALTSTASLIGIFFTSFVVIY